jgi:hypothetical protein
MSLPEKPPSAANYTQAEWEAFYRSSFRASSLLLSHLERELGEGGPVVNPQQAGVVLLLCMGRLQGRYGFRHVGASEAWERWVHADLRGLFELAFRSERAAED